jgi:hypothetical protein
METAEILTNKAAWSALEESLLSSAFLNDSYMAYETSTLKKLALETANF